MVVPVVTGDVDPAAVEDLIAACVHYDRIRAHAGAAGRPDAFDGGDVPGGTGIPDGTGRPDGTPSPSAPDGGSVPAGPGGGAVPAVKHAAEADRAAALLAMLEHQILARVIQVVSGPGGVASFLRRNLLGKGLGGPSLPLDAGQTDQIPAHLRRLVALRDQTCQHPGGCGQPAAGCEPHHVVHRADGGRTSLANLKDYCWWHHHVMLHQMGWVLTVHPDGTSQIKSPGGKIIRSHSPPPCPG
jgi:hypothetical protein